MDTVVNPNLILDLLNMNAFPSSANVRGMVNQAVWLDTSSYITGEFLKECLNDMAFCYNGYTISMWLAIVDPLTDNGVILDIGPSTSKAGLRLSAGPMSGGSGTQFSFDIRHGTKEVVSTFKLQTYKWTHVAFSVSDNLDSTLFINGIEKVYETISVTQGVYPSENLDVPVKMTFGVDNQHQYPIKLHLDDFYFFEYQMLENEIYNLSGKIILNIIFISLISNSLEII